MRALAQIPVIIGLSLVIACGDDSAADAGWDYAIPPVPDTSPPAPDVSLWTSEWPDELEVIEHQPLECEPWETPSITRGLPEDATPRVLWQYYPPDDPAYDIRAALGEAHVGWINLAPNGNLWVTGPRRNDVSLIGPDGRRIRWYLTRTDGLLDGDTSTLKALAVTPEGGLVILDHTVIQSGGGYDNYFGFGVLDADEGPDPGGYPSRPQGVGIALSDRPAVSVAMAPDGYLYIGMLDQVLVTCRGGVLLETLRLRRRETVRGGGVIAPVRMRVRDSGDLEMSFGQSTRLYTRTADGEISARQELPDVDRAHHRFRIAETPMFSLIASQYSRWVVSSAGVHDIGQGRFSLSPTGDLWSGDSRGDGPRRNSPPYTDTPLFISADSTESPVFSFRWGAWLEDGSFLSSNGNVLRRVSRSGEIMWSLDVEVSVGERNWVIDQTGVLYALGPSRIFAIQLDALPPPLSHCLHEGCNSFHDNHIRSELPGR